MQYTHRFRDLCENNPTTYLILNTPIKYLKNEIIDISNCTSMCANKGPRIIAVERNPAIGLAAVQATNLRDACAWVSGPGARDPYPVGDRRLNYYTHAIVFLRCSKYTVHV